MSMAVRKNDFMPSWLQSPNGEGQKAWKSGSGRDGLYTTTTENLAPAVTPIAPTPDGRRYSSFSLHNDGNSSRRSQRALSFEASEHSTYSRPTRPVGNYRRPAAFKSDFKGGSGGGGGGSAGSGGSASVDVYSRLPRQRSMEGWPRAEVNSSSQGLERNFHQHFPSLRATSTVPADNSSFNPGGAWENRHAPSSSRSHYSHVNSNSGYDSRRHVQPSHSLDSSPTDEETAANRSAMKAAVRPDRTPSMHHDSLSFDSANSSSAERSNMRLNLALNPASLTDIIMPAMAPLRQGKAQSPNGGKVTLRSLSKSETWKSQKIEEPTAIAPSPAHSAVAPWSSQAPPPPPAVPRPTVARTPEAPAVILQRQIETRSKGATKGTSESRLSFFKSLQGHGRSVGQGSAEDSPTDLTPASESNPMVEEDRLSSDSGSTAGHSSTLHAHRKVAEKLAGCVSSDAESRTSSEDSTLEEHQYNGALDRDHLTASFYDVVINSGKIPFDDTDDVNEEDRRVMKVWGWTPDAYDNVECITLGEVAKFQAVFRSYVSKKLQTDIAAKSSLGAQRLFQRHHRYLTIPSSIDASLSSSDCSASSSSSASSDEERK